MKKDIWNIKDLKEWDKNPRNIKEKDFKRLKNQIQKLGQYKPLLVNSGKNWGKRGTVAGGNMRLKAYREMGIVDIWVSLIDPKTKEEFLEYALSDNDRAGYYDDDMLANLIPEFDIDWEDYAVDLRPPMSLEYLINSQTNEDTVPEVSDDNIQSEKGEIYQLGRHRLMCGDATDHEDVDKLMDNQEADMVFTDPPYGVDYIGKTKKALRIENDKTTEVFANSLVEYARVVKFGAAFYVCCPAGNNFKDFLLPFEEECVVSSTIIWVKNSMVLGHGDYHYQHEPILYGWLRNGTHKFYGDRKQTTVWEIDRPTQSKDHPTMKPISLVARAINNSSKQDDIILDLFGGSGSTLIACEQTNRTCYMMEIDPRYCDVIRKRYDNFINKNEQQ